eukprot:TRINITY_DN5590_c0_g1_i1.p1 TRINITY_DN5590_c0_g1~~TRINITY_DN5590_c0_g1_i1.p1  ORF type:complete len:629 (+),score=105.23 TRINITY_DN5590_c0_g1_i1:74-1960(+)
MASSVVLALLPLACAATCFEGNGSCGASSVGQGLIQSSRTLSREMAGSLVSSGIVEKLGQGEQVDLVDIGQYVQGLVAGVAGHNYTMSDADEAAITTIQNMVGTMQNASGVQHAEDQAEVDRVRDLIANCSSDAASALGDVATRKQSMIASRSTHASCRSEEGAAQDEKNMACSAYDSHRKSNPPPACLPTDLTSVYVQTSEAAKQKQMETCLEATQGWLSPLYEKYRSCQLKTETHENQTELCNTKQHEFEQTFCDYKSKLDDACDVQTTCRARAITARNDTHRGVNNSVTARKADYTAGRKLLCFIGVLKANNTDKMAALEKCRNMTVDTSQYDIVYHSIPFSTSCVKEQSEPCDSAWTANEYTSTAWYAKAAMVVCRACPAPITTTTTQTSTTTTPSTFGPPTTLGLKFRIDATSGHMTQLGGSGTLIGFQYNVASQNSSKLPIVTTGAMSGKPGFNFLNAGVFLQGVGEATDVSQVFIAMKINSVAHGWAVLWAHTSIYGGDLFKRAGGAKRFMYADPNCGIDYIDDEVAIYSMSMNSSSRHVQVDSGSRNKEVSCSGIDVANQQLWNGGNHHITTSKKDAWVGMSAHLNNNFNGIIGEMLYYDQQLSSSDFNSVRQYLINKWL